MKQTLVFFLAIFHSLGTLATPRVPASMDFAGMKLTINETARKQIQEDVNALHRNQTYFLRKVEKADIYFPIIERIFREENLPEDFKYLVLQESALIADAVSVSNAVGFWQFKEGTAKEVGLRVDRLIDERMNITASSHAAAKYLKKNNFFFNNWIYALLAYNTGPGGAEAHINKKYLGVTRMDITKDTHWYVKKFLAHKVAFEDALYKNSNLDIRLYEYDKVNNKSVSDISNLFKIDQQTITDYNKWIRRGTVPDDKRYVATIPVSGNDQVAYNFFNPSKSIENKVITKNSVPVNTGMQPVTDFDFRQNGGFPVIEKNKSSTVVRVNGIPGFIASTSDNTENLYARHRVQFSRFMQYNDLTGVDRILPGQVYYLKAKKTKAKLHYHVVMPGETAWSVSQKYGIQLKSLLTKNRMKSEKELTPGMVLWLRFIRPADVPVEYHKVDSQNIMVASVPNSGTNSAKTPENKSVTERSLPAPGPAVPETEKKVIYDDSSDFLFEEVREDTRYIGENSFIDLTEPANTNLSTIPEPSSSSTKTVSFYHTVKQGETLFAVARQYDVTIGELRQWNNFDNLNQLKIGDRILIKQQKNFTPVHQNDANFITHTVKKEETLYSIARRYEVSVDELMQLNGKADYVISEGEIIRVRKK